MQDIKTKCEQLICYIKNHVEHDLQEGARLPPEAIWAKELSVNKSTLCKALLQLQHEGYVSRKTGVGTIVTFNGKHAVKNIITAVLFPDLTFTRDTYYSAFLREISRQTLQANRMHSVVNIGNADRQSINRERLEQLLRQPQLAGVIVTTSRLSDEETIVAIARSAEVPVVWAGTQIERPGVNYICTDNYRATLDLLARAEQAGYKRVTFISKTPNTLARQERRRAFVAKQGDNNVYIGEPAENALQAGYRIIRRLLADGRRPDCILAADKGTADGIRQALQENNSALPIPMLTFDYYFDEDRCDIAASAIQPLETMAQRAIEFIIKGDKAQTLRLKLDDKIFVAAP